MYKGQKGRSHNFYSSHKLLLGPFYLGFVNDQFNLLFCGWKVKYYCYLTTTRLLSTYEPGTLLSDLYILSYLILQLPHSGTWHHCPHLQIKNFFQGHTASNWRIWDSNLDCLYSQRLCFTDFLCWYNYEGKSTLEAWFCLLHSLLKD